MKRGRGRRHTHEGGEHSAEHEHHTAEGAMGGGMMEHAPEGSGMAERHGQEAGASDVAPSQSGAPEWGGATSSGSRFGGRSLWASLLRAAARIARSVEAEAYRRLRDLDQSAGEPTGARGRPNRVRQAFTQSLHEEQHAPH